MSSLIIEDIITRMVDNKLRHAQTNVEARRLAEELSNAINMAWATEFPDGHPLGLTLGWVSSPSPFEGRPPLVTIVKKGSFSPASQEELLSVRGFLDQVQADGGSPRLCFVLRGA